MGMINKFEVRLTVDGFGKSARSAAEEVWRNLRSAGSKACRFHVIHEDGTDEVVDLLVDGEICLKDRPEDLADLAPEMLEVLEWAYSEVPFTKKRAQVLARARSANKKAPGKSK